MVNALFGAIGPVSGTQSIATEWFRPIVSGIVKVGVIASFSARVEVQSKCRAVIKCVCGSRCPTVRLVCVQHLKCSPCPTLVRHGTMRLKQ